MSARQRNRSLVSVDKKAKRRKLVKWGLYIASLSVIIPWMLSSRGTGENTIIAGALFIACAVVVFHGIFRSDLTKKWYSGWKVVVTMMTVIVLVFMWIRTASQEITVYPDDDIVIHTGEYSNSSNVIVTNRTENPLYSVCVIIMAKTGGLMSKDIGVEVDTNFTAPRLQAGPIGARFDSWAYDFTFKDQRQAVVVTFYEIRPNSPRTIRVFGIGQEQGIVNATLVRFKRSPELLGKKDGKIRAETEVLGAGKITGFRYIIEYESPKK